MVSASAWLPLSLLRACTNEAFLARRGCALLPQADGPPTCSATWQRAHPQAHRPHTGGALARGRAASARRNTAAPGTDLGAMRARSGQDSLAPVGSTAVPLASE